MTDVQPGSALRRPVRNRYFYGKLLDAGHLQLEQDYLNGKRSLLNRLITGAGVVSGLEVAGTGDGRVTVAPGVALDADGHEIVVPALTDPVDPRQPTDEQGRPTGPRLVGAATVVLAVSLAERLAEPAPVYAGSDDGELATDASLVEEGFAVLVTAEAAPSGGGGIPLARLALPDADGVLAADAIDLSVRHVVRTGTALGELVDGLAAAVQRTQPARQLGYAAGDAQSQDPGTVLEEAVSVTVADASGAPVPGVAVTFTLRGRGGGLSPDGVMFSGSAQVTSGTDGSASARWRLPDSPGVATAAASIPGALPVTFVAFALPAAPATGGAPPPGAATGSAPSSGPTGNPAASGGQP